MIKNSNYGTLFSIRARVTIQRRASVRINARTNSWSTVIASIISIASIFSIASIASHRWSKMDELILSSPGNNPFHWNSALVTLLEQNAISLQITLVLVGVKIEEGTTRSSFVYSYKQANFFAVFKSSGA